MRDACDTIGRDLPNLPAVQDAEPFRRGFDAMRVEMRALGASVRAIEQTMAGFQQSVVGLQQTSHDLQLTMAKAVNW